MKPYQFYRSLMRLDVPRIAAFLRDGFLVDTEMRGGDTALSVLMKMPFERFQLWCGPTTEPEVVFERLISMVDLLLMNGADPRRANARGERCNGAGENTLLRYLIDSDRVKRNTLKN